MKRVTSLLLSMLIALALLPVSALAEPAARAEKVGSFVYIDPFYRNTHTDEEMEADLAELLATAQPTRSIPHYTSFDSAALYIRAQMVARNTSITLTVPDTMVSPTNDDLKDALFEKAVEHVKGGSPQEGDSLLKGMGFCYRNVEWSSGKYTLTYTPNYSTTAAQEAVLTSEVNSAMAALNLSGKTEKQKVRAIHDFICDRVNYDYDHVDDSSYLLQYSAYAAMHNRTAVCQGYAVLFYRMCMEAGLDVRVVFGNNHAWNIVRIGSVYYNIDTTWDGQDDPTYYTWYLKGMRDFPRHPRDPRFFQESFDRDYPMALDPKMTLDNLTYTFTTIFGDTFSTEAVGKPKLLIFGDITHHGTRFLLQTLADYDLSKVDVAFFEDANNSLGTVIDAIADIGLGNMAVTVDGGPYTQNVMWQYINYCGYSESNVYIPVLIYIDENNMIRQYSFDRLTEYTVTRYVKEYLGLTLKYAAPRIFTQPKDCNANVGDNVSLTLISMGKGTMNYTWYYRTSPSGSWAKCPDATNYDTYFFTATAEKDGWQFKCKVTSEYGSTYSRIATLNVFNGPEINVQPRNVSAPIGDTAQFNVGAAGVGLTYQWQYKSAGGTSWNTCSMDGNKTSTLSVPVTAARNGYQYRCKITDSTGKKAYTNAATLSVKIAITSQPKSISAPLGETAVFKVAATGVSLTYQWQYKAPGSDHWVNSTADGAKTNSLKVSVTAARNGQKYHCVVKDANGKQYTSDAAKLTVKIAITAQPGNVTLPIGETAQFKVTATGVGLTYQWQYKAPGSDSWINSTADGAKTNSLKVSVTAARNGQKYHCVVKDANGKQYTSDAAKLYVKTKITSQPQNVTADVGDTATFTVKASGAGLTYQWQYKTATGSGWNNCTTTGCETATLSVHVTVGRIGYQYRCKITDANGKNTISDSAILTTVTGIYTQPDDACIPIGDTATFTVKAAGVGLKYQWQYLKAGADTWNNSTMDGSKTDTLTVPVTAARNGYRYRCQIADSDGNIFIPIQRRCW